MTVTLGRPGDVKMAVYDLLGRLVDRHTWQNAPAGEHRYAWQPEHLSSGVYFLRMSANGVAAARKVVLLQ